MQQIWMLVVVQWLGNGHVSEATIQSESSTYDECMADLRSYFAQDTFFLATCRPMLPLNMVTREHR